MLPSSERLGTGAIGWWVLEVLAIEVLAVGGDLGGGAGGLELDTDDLGPEGKAGGLGDEGSGKELLGDVGSGKELLEDLELGGGAGGLEPVGGRGGCKRYK
jgi:hypothetical protein